MEGLIKILKYILQDGYEANSCGEVRHMCRSSVHSDRLHTRGKEKRSRVGTTTIFNFLNMIWELIYIYEAYGYFLCLGGSINFPDQEHVWGQPKSIKQFSKDSQQTPFSETEEPLG